MLLRPPLAFFQLLALRFLFGVKLSAEGDEDQRDNDDDHDDDNDAVHDPFANELLCGQL